MAIPMNDIKDFYPSAARKQKMSKYINGMFIGSIAMVVFNIAQHFTTGHLYLWAGMEFAWIASFVLFLYCMVQHIRRDK